MIWYSLVFTLHQKQKGTIMKLAEALCMRADLQKYVEQLRSRLMDNMKVQEGDQPAEQPTILFTELNNVLPQLESLIVKINLTNTQMKIGDKTMTQLLAEKDILKKKLEIYRSAYSKAIIRNERNSRNEIRFVSTIDGESMQKKIDKMSKEYRELDMRIQQANWTTELVD